jgi:hypothetical protein
VSTRAGKSASPIVLVRTYSAGIHVGKLISQEGSVVKLASAHRVWRWKGANSLSELSQRGGDRSYTRISEEVPEIVLTGAIEIIPCSAAAAKDLCEARWPA